MLTSLADQLPFDINPSSAAILSAALLAWVAIVYLVMAFGVRSGDLVWSGRHPGRLPTEHRWWSLLYGVGLLLAGFALLDMTGAMRTGLLEDTWQDSAGFAVGSVLGVATVLSLARGSTWERMLFVPITLLGAGLAAWLTFG
ncbi:MAG TPA: hypothetical protein VK969_07930 [Acidimicrobiia bacterium]|nr:hypothetical protein [Acidimicrobiia bacterium]